MPTVRSRRFTFRLRLAILRGMSGMGKDTASLRAWYGASIADFIATSAEAVLGQLATNCDFALIPTQRGWSCSTNAELRDVMSEPFAGSGMRLLILRGELSANRSGVVEG